MFEQLSGAQERYQAINDRLMDPNVVSDLGIAALTLKTAMQSAWLNVLINLGGIRDEAFVNEYKAKGEAILAEALPLADKIYNEILASL